MMLIRRLLDPLYAAAAVMAAICLVGILLVIVAQMGARWASIPFPGSSEYAGYLMASASFLAFASALNGGAHIRVGLFLGALGKWRRWGEVWCFLIGTAASTYLAFYAVKLVYWSHKLGDVSQGQDETAMWIPQAPFAAGAVLLAVAFADNLLSLILTGKDNMAQFSEADSHAE